MRQVPVSFWSGATVLLQAVKTIQVRDVTLKTVQEYETALMTHY